MHAKLEIKEVQIRMRKRQFVHLAYIAEVGEEFRDTCIT